MIKLSIYTFIYLSIGVCLENTTIDGYVYDSSQSPIYNAEIYIEDLSKGTVTDSSGYFKISIPISLENANNYIFKISHIAYISKEINLSKLIDYPEIYLDKNVRNTDEIVVSALGYKSYIKDTPVITHVITSKDIYNSPYSSATDIIELVMPNVQRVHDPHGTDDKLKVQGLDSRFVVFMIDGNRVSGEFAGNIDLSIININDIEKIEVIRSGMSTLYGSDSMGGLINIITKKNNRPLSFNMLCNYDPFIGESLSAGLGAKLYKFNYKLGLSYNNSPGYDLTEYSPLSKTIEENLNYKISNTLSYSGNDILISYMNQYYAKEVNLYNYRADYEEDGVPVVVDGLLSDKGNSRYSDFLNTLSINYKNLKLNISKELYNKGFYYPYYYDSYPNSKKGKTITSATPTRYDFSIFFNTLLHSHRILIGIEYARETYQSYDVLSNDGSEVLTPSIFLNDKQESIDEYSIVATDQFKILNKDLVLGCRATKYSSYKWNLIPSVSIRQNIGQQSLRMNYSRGYRIPSIKELYYSFPEHPMQPLYGNPDLKPSTSNYYAISLESIEYLNSSLEVYYNNVFDMISPLSTANSTMEYMNTDQVSLYGFNVNYNTEFSDVISVKSVFSYTAGNSNTKQLIDGISKYSFNVRGNIHIAKDVDLLFASKYNSAKDVFIYSSNGSSGNFYNLNSYWLSDILVSFKYNKISIKCGVKNMFNYTSISKNDYQAGENLSTIDPGRRFYMSLGFSI